MDRIRTLIVDDEKPARRRLAELLGRELEIDVVGEARDGREAVDLIRSQTPDLMFLDIQMPDLDGFAVLGALDQEQQPLTVFVTAYDRYAIQAFEAHAVDYLLKPFSDQRFEGALRRACQFLRAQRSGETHAGSPIPEERSVDTKTGFLERFVLKAAGRVTFLGVEDVDWIEASGVYVNLHVGPRSH